MLVPEKLKFKLLLPSTVSFSTLHQRRLIKQRLIFSAAFLASASSPLWYAAPPNSDIQKQIIPECTGIIKLFWFQISTGNIKKKLPLSISRHKVILNKHLSACFLWTLKYIGKREWIRLLGKLRWLKMQVMLTFFVTTIWNIYL